MASDESVRPHVWIEQLKFNDDSLAEIGPSDMIAIVGPNNAGKSALLREMRTRLEARDDAQTRILIGIEYKLTGNEEELLAWARRVGRQQDSGGWQLPYGGFGPRGLETSWQVAPRNGLRSLTDALTVYLNTERRLSAASPVELVNFTRQISNTALHKFYLDDRLEKELDRLFRRAFRQGVVVNRGAGNQTMLHVGERPRVNPGEDRQSFAFLKAVNEMPPLHEQGDGMRSFAGVLVEVLGADRDILFIDEPEAFLHPPQAVLLGKFLVEKTPGNRQLFVATHSSDVMRGLLSKQEDRLRVLRIVRQNGINKISELKAAQISNLWADPILRFSRVLEGLFHDAVIVCEGDADCRFYEAMTDALFAEESRPDILFVHGAGKTRSPVIAAALKSIGVPVKVVLDFDALADEHLMGKLCSVLGGNWGQIEPELRATISAVNQRRAELPMDDVRQSISNLLSEVRSPTLPESSANSIRAVLRRGSAWSEAKRMGKAFIPAGQAVTTYSNLHLHLREMGLHVVEVGELESFCRSIGAHGPAWVSEVLQRDLASDAELRDAREFTRELVSGLQSPT